VKNEDWHLRINRSLKKEFFAVVDVLGRIKPGKKTANAVVVDLVEKFVKDNEYIKSIPQEITATTKFCTGCHTELSFSEFNRNASKKGGIEFRCKSCLNKYQRENRRKKKQC